MLDYGDKINDNSTKINQWTDSFNATSSWAQTLSDIGNVRLDVNKPGNALQQLVPVLVVGLVVVAAVAIFRKT
ncbi:MAG: hypothetical protein DVB31_05430 [Verrucomicrobia bacterium]|nr:MAG: hypothetical protein DVB31_05430 [Verrucomicrobiota bacterium]